MAQPATKSTALWVLRRLRRAGHQALLAGGCVRDMLLGQRCTDYDVATDATPDQVRRLFRHVLLIGAKFGVAMVVHGGKKVEVTTFRSDLSYSDGRRPDAVRFTTAEQDAQRRDFTINGMFYDPLADKVIDYVRGQADLRSGIVRTIGHPADRFAEDYLRMVRAVRFAVRLGFTIEPATAEAICRFAPRIVAISGERIFDELTKMLALPSAAQAVGLLEQLRLLGPILPELADAEPRTRAIHRLAALARRKDPVLSLAALLADLPPKSISRILRRWGASNQLRDACCWLAEHLGDWPRAGRPTQPGQPGMALCDFKRLLGSEHFGRLKLLWAVEEKRLAGGAQCARQIARRAAAIPTDQIAPPPLVTGADLMALGLAEGPRLGRILRDLYDAQLNEDFATRAEAMERTRQMI